MSLDKKFRQTQIPKKISGKLTVTPSLDVQYTVKNNKIEHQTDRFIPSRKSNIHHVSLVQQVQKQCQYEFSLSKLFLRQVIKLGQNGFFKYSQRNTAQQLQQYSSIRKISKSPYKVLDAPSLQDDFYLSLIDWSSNNYLSVGLSTCVYLWSAQTSKVTRLCDFADSFYTADQDSVAAVAWAPSTPLLSIGTQKGSLQIWDTQKLIKVRDCLGHTNRVGTIAWSNSILSSGSRDKSIINWDPRAGMDKISKLTSHRQQVCGLKWSPDQQQLASGGNDNNMYIWNMYSNVPVCKFSKHKAAVKAISWSPHQHGLLASGGGTADRKIRFWNTLESTLLNEIDSGSQVCNLQFSKNVNELVSTHGYSQNQIIIWKYPQSFMLIRHTYRVLFLAMSPDGKSIVTGAGDQTLRFWNVFPSPAQQCKVKFKSLLSPDLNQLR